MTFSELVRLLERRGFHMVEEKGSVTGVGHSIEDCVYQARWGMAEHVRFLEERRLPVPPPSESPRIIIQNEQAATEPV